MKTLTAVKDKIKLSKNKRYLVHSDEKPFFYLADTWWYGATNRTNSSAFRTLVSNRKKLGFSAVQIVVGYPPEVSIDSLNAANSGGWPLNTDFTINESYFAEVDKRIKYLIKNDLVPMIFGSWGYHINLLGETQIKLLWSEIIRRYDKYNVIWCLAGEVDLPPQTLISESQKNISGKIYLRLKTILNKSIIRKILRLFVGKPVDSQIETWRSIANYISKNSSNLLTAHIHTRKSAYDLFNSPNWLDINTIQSGHSRDGIRFMIEATRQSQKLKLPFINLEPYYEGIMNDYYDKDQRYSFWAAILSGAKGYSYGANGVWQMSTKEDPFLTHWGKSDWSKAMKLDGATQISKGKKWLMNYRWWEIIPDINALTPTNQRLVATEPIVGKIKDSHILIYMPIGRLHKTYQVIGLDHNTKYQVKYITPETMLTHHQEVIIKKSLYSVTCSQETDWLILLEKN